MPELRAGERIDVSSTLTSPARDPGLLRKAGFAVLVVLALVGAASLVRPFIGL